MKWDSNLPRNLLLQLITEYNTTVFVETGTQNCITTLCVEPLFNKVHTVECGIINYLRARENTLLCPRITCWYGSAELVLPEIIATLTEPTLFWLDAHYSGPDTYAIGTECPLLYELDSALKYDASIVLIDDARMFDRGDRIDKGQCHSIEEWPTMLQIEDAVVVAGRHITQVGDILVVTPQPFKNRPMTAVNLIRRETVSQVIRLASQL